MILTDILVESRVEKPFPLYVPRDERFEESKQITFSTSRLKAVLHNLLPSMVANISKKHDFKGFSQIESLYSEGVPLKFGLQDDILKKLRLPNIVSSQGGNLLKYDIPKILSSKHHTYNSVRRGKMGGLCNGSKQIWVIADIFGTS